MILLTTSKYGAGVSSDAARNLSTADNLLAGNGFVDMIGAPFVLWPPLYPLVIAGLSLPTGLSTFQAAWFLNVALYALDLWLGGWLLYRVFADRPAFAVVGALVLLFSRSMLRIYANVASEPLFETFLLLFFLACARYLRDRSRGALWAMFVVAGLATLQRYLGVVLFGVASVAVLYEERWKGVLRAALPAVLSAAPIAAWAVLHNIPSSGAPFGPRDLGEMLPMQNISLSLTKILWWFLPRLSSTDPLILRPWIVVAVVVVVLVLLNRRDQWRTWRRALSGPYVWPMLLFSVAYFLLLAFTVVTADHLDLTSDRYYIVILPAVIAFVLITLDALLFSHLRGSRAAMAYVVPLFAALWFIYPLYAMQGYVREALVKGEPTNYNIANSSQFREMKVVKAAQVLLAEDAHSTLYTNYVNIVWFLFRHPMQIMPFENQDLPKAQRLAELRQHYAGWPPEHGYIIWFTPNQYHHIAAPDELATIAKLKLLYSDKTGQIYEVEAGK
ncbi:MAG: hypothetical protein ACM3MF_06715 [Anaerolineae bacterium]